MSEQAWQAQPAKSAVCARGVQIRACCAQDLGKLAHPEA